MLKKLDQKSFVSKNRLEFFRIRKFQNKENRVAIVVFFVRGNTPVGFRGLLKNIKKKN